MSSTPSRPPLVNTAHAAAARLAPPERPFTISDVTFRARGQVRSAMVITPKHPMVIDRERLNRVSNSSSLSPVEQWLVDEARSRGEGARVLLFRAANSENRRVWEFDRNFDEANLRHAGLVMTRALLPLHRALVASGVVLMVHTDWGSRESYAMRCGVHALSEELTLSAPASAGRQLDQWILRNMLMHVALSLDHVTRKLLPSQMGLIERRWPRVAGLL